MTALEARQHVLGALTRVAPEIDPSTLDADRPLRDQVDLDSVDFLNFVVDLHARTTIDIPEADYGRLASITAAIEYIIAAASASPETPLS